MTRDVAAHHVGKFLAERNIIFSPDHSFLVDVFLRVYSEGAINGSTHTASTQKSFQQVVYGMARRIEARMEKIKIAKPKPEITRMRRFGICFQRRYTR